MKTLRQAIFAVPLKEMFDLDKAASNTLSHDSRSAAATPTQPHQYGILPQYILDMQTSLKDAKDHLKAVREKLGDEPGEATAIKLRDTQKFWQDRIRDLSKKITEATERHRSNKRKGLT